jgi:hypothetical protein
MIGAVERHLVWPADRFFWAVIATHGLPSSLVQGTRHRRQRLDYLVEGDLPLPLRQLQIVYTTIDRKTTLACALPRPAFGEVDGAHSLCPDSVPEFLGVSVDPRRFNMLVGDYEPLVVQRERRRWRALALVLLVTCVVLAAIGAERRIRSFQEDERQAIQRTADCYASLGFAGDPGLSAARLTAELREMEATAAAQATDGMVSHATPLLASLLAAWPSELPAGFETLIIGPDSITITATVETPTSAQQLADSLRAAASGYSMSPPQLTGARSGTRVTLVLERQEEGL